MSKSFSWQPCLLPIAGLALLCSTNLNAETTPYKAETTPYKYVALIDGSCQEVSINGHPLNGLCGQTLLNTLYVDGRTSFGFILNNKAVLSFSGTHDSQPSPDHYHMDVNRLTVITSDQQAQPLAASGACDVFGDITQTARITCEAGTAGKDQFLVSFTTTAPPDIVMGR